MSTLESECKLQSERGSLELLAGLENFDELITSAKNSGVQTEVQEFNFSVMNASHGLKETKRMKGVLHTRDTCMEIMIMY
jgi:hypothetical protein